MSKNRFGFTLVELLVVITIISILMGLLIPAIGSGRETSRRAQCQSRVRNLALACLQFELVKNEMPAWVRKYGVFAGGGDRSDPLNFSGSVPRHVKVGGYGVELLPWLDGQPTYEHWTDDSYPVVADSGSTYGATHLIGDSFSGAGFHRLATPNLANFQCPSNPNTDADGGRNSYISNNGMCHFRTIAAATAGGVTAGQVCTHLRSQRLNNGVFKARYTGVASSFGFHGRGPSVQIDDLRDGRSNTALFSENIQALPWYLPGFLNGAGPEPNLLVQCCSATDLTYESVNRSNPGELNASQFTAGWVWHYEDPQATLLNAAGVVSPNGLNVAIDQFALHKINGGGPTASQDIFNLQMTYRNSPDLARPSSAHVDGVNISFADGAARFVTDSIDETAERSSSPST
ncbi:MAG: DUF1559 domain-containing protein, partial [Pirellulales bacterium]|nr:DUF1559 domain-containing protein [Pirellulales bacterium]